MNKSCVMCIKKLSLFYLLFNTYLPSFCAPISLERQITVLKRQIGIECNEINFKKLGLTEAKKSIDVFSDNEIALRLVDLLDKQTDEQSKQLLSKFNRLFYFESIKALTHLDAKNIAEKQQKALFTRALKTLYDHRANNEFAFDTILTKIILQCEIIKNSWLSGEDRNELLSVALLNGQETLMKKNNALGNEHKIEDKIIESLIDGLTQYYFTPEKEGIKDQVISTGIKVAGGVLVMVVGYYLMKKLINHFTTQSKELTKDVKKNIDELANELLKKTKDFTQQPDLAGGLLDNLFDNINITLGQFNIPYLLQRKSWDVARNEYYGQNPAAKQRAQNRAAAQGQKT